VFSRDSKRGYSDIFGNEIENEEINMFRTFLTRND
jgi:hypothetical protein